MGVPKVSVVVTAYNLEKYLAECLDAIRQQTFTDFECIVVNDGSVDGTQDIIDQYTREDLRFRAIHKENGGVSTARNVGLDAARGEYMIFLDGDDFYEPRLLECLYAKIMEQRADIAVCNFKSYFQSMHKFSGARIDFSVLKKGDRTSYAIDPDYILYTPTLMFWNKLFRTEFLRQRNIRNDETLHRAQDIEAVGRALVSTKRIAIVDEVLVFYRTEAGNSNVSRLYKYPYDVLIALERLTEHLHSKLLYEKVRKSYIKFTVDHVLAALYVTEVYPVHKQIYHRSKKFLTEIGVQDASDDCFSDEKSRKEARMLLSASYEKWLQFRVADLRDDRESKYISYLLGVYQDRLAEAEAAREHMRLSVSWKVTKPLRAARRIFKYAMLQKIGHIIVNNLQAAWYNEYQREEHTPALPLFDNITSPAYKDRL